MDKDRCIYCKKVVWFWQWKMCEYIDGYGNPVGLYHLKCFKREFEGKQQKQERNC